MSTVRKALFFSALGKYGEFGLFLLGTIVLSRLLSPKEIGIFAAANSIIAFAQTIRMFGTNDYLIQEKSLEVKDVRKALAVASVLSWILAGLLAAFSSVIANYFKEPLLQKVILLVAVSFLFLPISSTAHARLSRDMKFGTISIIGLLSALTNLSVAIILALNGFGALSIAWATFAANLALLIATAVLAPHYMLVRPHFVDLKKVFTFGSWVTASSIIRNIGYNGYLLIIARMLSFEALGLYMRAATIVERFTTILLDIIKSVALPSFAEIKRSGKPAGPAIMKTLALMAGCLWPVYAFVGLHAEPIVGLLFGDQWFDAVPVVQILAVSVVVSMNLPALLPTVLTAYGRVKIIFVFNVIMYATRVVGVLLAVQHGLSAVAIAVTISSIVAVPLYVWVLKSMFNIPILDFISTHVRAGILTALSLLPSLVFTAMGESEDWTYFAVLFFSGSSTFLIWIALSGFFIPAIADERRKGVANIYQKIQSFRR
ncbi:lipopolysaccharide biosynthesis protein [Kordiimonas aestuarii]|uniref:lipopolysaccharide biosynthesis protein n=1 Tax=Kordiimonas aestuarii TaxID=1005925 RepID=UPI0021CF04AB|nr:lipopolysaccharide biosynthesis protein [Kordiimonas aestuarii]